tara:strand:- start:962 stop:1150 length:189 start_codon:yes stop_codon:yes gene_type:complete
VSEVYTVAYISSMVAMSIFLTCTLFFIVYGLAYLGSIAIIAGAKRIKSKLNELKEDKGSAGY